MVFTPQPESSVWKDEVLPSLQFKSDEFTHTVRGSGNWVLSREIFTAQLTIYNQALFYVYLSGTLQYAGKAITEEDCRDLNVPPENVNLRLINGWQSFADLEAKALEKGVTQDPGDYATGRVVVLANGTGKTVPQGTRFATDPDEAGERLTYIATEDTPLGANAESGPVPVQAVERGTSYNVGEGRVSSVETQPDGITIADVNNADAIDGGTPPEDPEDMRERAMNALSRQSGGGTEFGIIGGLTEALDGLTEDDVELVQYDDPSDPASEHDWAYFDAIIDFDGAFPAPDSDTDPVRVPATGDPVYSLEELMGQLKPYGMMVQLKEPAYYTVNATVTVAPEEPSETEATEGDINALRAEEAFVNHIRGHGLGDDLYEARLTSALTGADADIAYPPTFDVNIAAEDGTTTELSSVFAVSEYEKVVPGEISVEAVPNPSGGS